MATRGHDKDDGNLGGGHLYRLDLERWWALVRQHLAHPSADFTVLELDPEREFIFRSNWDWAGVKSTLDQVMAVATTQLLAEDGVPTHHPDADD